MYFFFGDRITCHSSWSTRPPKLMAFENYLRGSLKFNAHKPIHTDTEKLHRVSCAQYSQISIQESQKKKEKKFDNYFTRCRVYEILKHLVLAHALTLNLLTWRI